MSSDIKADKKRIAEIAGAVREKRPLVHCITNYVTVNDCANALLAIGASPVMADDEREIADIVAIASALVINIGTLNDRTIRSMVMAGKVAAKRGIPVILDPVGAGASKLRTETALSLIAEIPFAVIRGNASEIRILATGTGTTRGVDASESDTAADRFEALRDEASNLAQKTGAVIAITGATDIVSDGTNVYAIKNGHPLMSRITGSGCMLSAITGAFAAARTDNLVDAVAAAIATMGIAGEKAARAEARHGTGSYRVALIDALSRLDAREVASGMRIDAL